MALLDLIEVQEEGNLVREMMAFAAERIMGTAERTIAPETPKPGKVLDLKLTWKQFVFLWLLASHAEGNLGPV